RRCVAKVIAALALVVAAAWAADMCRLDGVRLPCGVFFRGWEDTGLYDAATGVGTAPGGGGDADGGGAAAAAGALPSVAHALYEREGGAECGDDGCTRPDVGEWWRGYVRRWQQPRRQEVYGLRAIPLWDMGEFAWAAELEARAEEV